MKTVAGFLNTDGGTLLIGVGPDRQVVGLDHDYPRVKPPNGDGFVNWLTTHLNNAIGHAAVMRTRARIALHDGKDICRLDVARSSQPVWAVTSQKERVFFVRMNNSTRELPEGELDKYMADRWPDLDSGTWKPMERKAIRWSLWGPSTCCIAPTPTAIRLEATDSHRPTVR